MNRSGPVFFQTPCSLPTKLSSLVCGQYLKLRFTTLVTISSVGHLPPPRRPLVLTHYQRVTDRRTDTPPVAKSRFSIAERDKNQ